MGPVVPMNNDDTEKPKVPLTAKNPGQGSFAFGKDVTAHSTRSPEETGSSLLSFKDQSQIDYLINRDPMQEFFALTCQSIKLNSPHMNTICTIDTM